MVVLILFSCRTATFSQSMFRTWPTGGIGAALQESFCNSEVHFSHLVHLENALKPQGMLLNSTFVSSFSILGQTAKFLLGGERERSHVNARSAALDIVVNKHCRSLGKILTIRLLYPKIRLPISVIVFPPTNLYHPQGIFRPTLYKPSDKKKFLHLPLLHPSFSSFSYSTRASIWTDQPV